MLTLVDIAALAITGTLCLFGIFHGSFRDNFLQCVGMAGVCISSAGRIVYLWDAQSATPGWTLVHICVAIYAVGTAQSTIVAYGRAIGWRWLRRLDRWHGHKTGRDDFDDRPHHHFPPR